MPYVAYRIDIDSIIYHARIICDRIFYVICIPGIRALVSGLNRFYVVEIGRILCHHAYYFLLIHAIYRTIRNEFIKDDCTGMILWI